MKQKRIVVTSVILVLTIVNYLRFFGKSNTRAVEVVSILAMGIALGVLITQIAEIMLKKDKA